MFNFYHQRLCGSGCELTVDLVVFAFLPRRAQDVVALSLRKAIVSWIDENPDELVRVYSQDDPVSYHAEKLFDIIITIPDLSNRRDTMWPLAMALSLLCPETLTLAVRGILLDARSRKEYNYTRVSKKIVFFDNLRQCLRIEGLCEVGAICMTDLAKTVYLLPEQADLIRYINTYEKEMRNLIFDSASPMYRQSRDRVRLSQLVFDKLATVYRGDPEEFNDILVNKAYYSHSNTYITFNMARFCREYNRRSQVKLDPDDFRELYPIVAPRIRRLLQQLLQSYSPTSPASPDRPSARGPPSVDKADLIIEILRNYMANIDIALEGTKLDNKLQTKDDAKMYDETTALDFIIEECVASKQPDIAEVGADFVELLYAPENAWRWANYAKSNPDDGHHFWQYTYGLS